MLFRRLGRTGLQVGVVGLGTEYLYGKPRETVVSVVRSAVDQGINYIDWFTSDSDDLDNFGAALSGIRDKVVVAGHIGWVARGPQKSRDPGECEKLFEQMLRKLRTDYVDVVNIFFVDEEDDYQRVVAPGGVLELAKRLVEEGKARFIGMSNHYVPTALQAVESGHFDLLMHPVNLSWDALPGKKVFFERCANLDVGLVAMKTFGGGELLQGKNQGLLTPAQCIHYSLSQAGVATVVPGAQSVSELAAALRYLEAPDVEKSYASVLERFQKPAQGDCVYCNHCLPCPAGINIGETMRFGEHGVGPRLLKQYEQLPSPASTCTECRGCEAICPFGVPVVDNMRRTAELFLAG